MKLTADKLLEEFKTLLDNGDTINFQQIADRLGVDKAMVTRRKQLLESQGKIKHTITRKWSLENHIEIL